MQLLIDIPEKTVNEIKDNALFTWSISSDIRWDVTSAIVNGTPFEKIRDEIKQIKPSQGHFYDGVEKCLEIIDKSKERITE